MADYRLRFQSFRTPVKFSAQPSSAAQGVQGVALRRSQPDGGNDRLPGRVKRLPARPFTAPPAWRLVNGDALAAVARLGFADGFLNFTDARVNDRVQAHLFRAPPQPQQHVVRGAVLARVGVAEPTVVIHSSDAVSVLVSPCAESSRDAARFVFDWGFHD